MEIERLIDDLNKITRFEILSKHEVGLTRRSLIIRSLDLSADNPWVALGTVNHIIDHIEDLTAPEWEDTNLDTDSISLYSSASDSNSSINSDTNKEDKGLESNINGQGLSSRRTDQEDQDFGVAEGIGSETVKTIHISWGVAQQNQVTQTPSNECRIDVDKSKTQTSSTPDLHHESSAPSGLLGWTRRLLSRGCNTVEKSLRGIAKFGYVLEDAVDNVAEVMARVDGQDAETSSATNPEQVVESKTPQQMITLELSKDVGTKQFEDLPSTQPVVNSELVNKATSLPPTLDPQDIPLRKAELLQAVRMEKKVERKAHYLADKAKIKKELKV